MPFTQTSPAELDRIAKAVLATLRTLDNHPLADPRGLTFRDIEHTAHLIGQRVAAQLTAEALATYAEHAPDEAACPTCQLTCHVVRKKRPLLTPDGPVAYLEPAAHCDACRRAFFPATSGVASGRTPV